jgi:hypothetical protein
MDYMFKNYFLQTDEPDKAKAKTRAYGYLCKGKDLAKLSNTTEKPEVKQQ